MSDELVFQNIFQTLDLLKSAIGTTITPAQLQQYTSMINNQIGNLQGQINTINAELGTVNTQIALILASGIANPGFYSINRISNPAGDIEFIAGSGIAISGNANNKVITISLY